MASATIKFGDIVEITGLPRGRVEYALKVDVLDEIAHPGSQGRHRTFTPGSATKLALLALLIGYGQRPEQARQIVNFASRQLTELGRAGLGHRRTDSGTDAHVFLWVFNGDLMAADQGRHRGEWAKLNVRDVRTGRQAKAPDAVLHQVEIDLNALHARFIEARTYQPE